MKRDNAFRLVTLGRIALLTPDGREEDTLGKRRRKLALLAMVALSSRPLPRDLLIEIFWGDQDEARARHSLSDTLSHLRRVLGRDALSTRTSDVALGDDAPLLIDTREFEAAVSAQDFATAVGMYGGPFLDGLYVEGSSRWDQWVSRERVKLEELFLKACDKQCMALARTRKWQECGDLAARWLEISPASTDAALYRLNALKAPGTREADARALEEFGRLEQRLRKELEVSPAPPVVALAKSIATRLAEAGEKVGEVETVRLDARVATPASVLATPSEREPATVSSGASVLPAAPVAPVAPSEIESPESFPATTEEWRAMRSIPLPNNTAEWRALRDRLSAPQPVVTRRPRWPYALAAGLITVAIALAGWQLRVRTTREAIDAGSVARPSVAIVGISTTGDSAHRWLRDGIGQMMAATLSRTTAVEIVPPERVRQILARAELDTSSVIARDRLLDIGKRLGATWVVSGAVAGGDSMFVFDVNVHDVASGDRVAFAVVQARSPTGVAEAAAARVLAAAGSASPGPRLADIETSNVEAYERYTRASLANSQGRSDDARRDLDAAIALDSSFVSAIRMRLSLSASAEEVVRYSELFARHESRASDFDRYWKEVNDAMLAGEHARSEALGRNFVARFPRDPRSYELLAFVYAHHGRFDELMRTLRAELALDSLALEVGSGACAACGAYQGIAESYINQAKGPEAIRTARRWVELQPDAPAAWLLLARAFATDQQHSASIDAIDRAIELSGNRDAWYQVSKVRFLIMARDYASADRITQMLLRSSDARARSFGWDVRVTLDRELGLLRKSIDEAERAKRDIAGMEWLDLMTGNSLARLGRYDEAVKVYERATHPTPLDHSDAPAHSARAFVWHHALMADAIRHVADTVHLDAIADSLHRVGPRSYYGRDWRLSDHVRGLVESRKGQFEQAASSFRRAIWIPNGWTRTNAELAEAEMALGRPGRAIDALRPAYAATPDAMGRYLTRSELDYLMALAFRQAGQADSALVYTARVQKAWRDADPEVRQLLDSLQR